MPPLSYATVSLLPPPKRTTTNKNVDLEVLASAGNESNKSRTSTIHSNDQNNTANETEEAIQVAIRLRPLNQKESSRRRSWKVIESSSSVTQITGDGKALPNGVVGRTLFTFDKTFGEGSSTQEVYESVVQGIVHSVVSGLNGTIFAYGQTSSGKTYTMQGPGTIQQGAEEAGRGIIHMASDEIFCSIQQQSDRIFEVRTSFLEIYNEEVRDLLSHDNRTLQIREDPRRGVFVEAQEENVSNLSELLTVLSRGEQSRAFASTAMNERSSRSHTIFRIVIESRADTTRNNENAPNQQRYYDDDDGATRISTLNLVDLAGSENVRNTGATGERLKEGGMINTSLLSLSRVITALGSPNQSHVNFRDSKLTRILQPSLSGNARMAIICCATPSALFVEETRSTLMFASRAKLVKTRAKVNEVLDDRAVIRRLQRELDDARKNAGGDVDRDRLHQLEQELAAVDTKATDAKEKLRKLQDAILHGAALFSTAPAITGEPNSVHRPKRRRRSVGAIVEGPASIKDPSDWNRRILPQAFTPRHEPWETSSRSQPPLSPFSEVNLLKEAVVRKNKVVSSMATRLESATRLLDAKNKENTSLRTEKESSCQEVEHLTSVIESLRTELASLTQTYNTAMREKDDTIDAAKRQLDKELAERAELEKTVELLRNENEALRKELDQQSKDHSEIQVEYDMSKRKYSELLAQQVSDKEELESRNERIMSEKVQVENELLHLRRTHEETTQRMERENAELSTQLEGQSKTLFTVRVEKAKASAMVAMQTKANEKLRNTHEEAAHRMERENLQLSTQLEEQSKTLLTVRAEKAKAISMVAMQSKENEKLRSMNEMAAFEKEQVENELLNLKKKFDVMSKELEQANTECEKAFRKASRRTGRTVEASFRSKIIEVLQKDMDQLSERYHRSLDENEKMYKNLQRCEAAREELLVKVQELKTERTNLRTRLGMLRLKSRHCTCNCMSDDADSSIISSYGQLITI